MVNEDRTDFYKYKDTENSKLTLNKSRDRRSSKQNFTFTFLQDEEKRSKHIFQTRLEYFWTGGRKALA